MREEIEDTFITNVGGGMLMMITMEFRMETQGSWKFVINYEFNHFKLEWNNRTEWVVDVEETSASKQG